MFFFRGYYYYYDLSLQPAASVVPVVFGVRPSDCKQFGHGMLHLYSVYDARLCDCDDRYVQLENELWPCYGHVSIIFYLHRLFTFARIRSGPMSRFGGSCDR